MKTFCIAGPVNPEQHYFIARRLDKTDQIAELLEQQKYFVLHAPRQSGKTTAIKELVGELNMRGIYKALYVNVEPAQAARSNVLEGLCSILDIFKEEMARTFGGQDAALKFFERYTVTGNAVSNLLAYWSRSSVQPTVLFIDEIDSLVGDTLISVLRQLRAGYPNRPADYPQSVCLVGVRDVRDYRIWSDDAQHSILGGSAFNIKAESLTLPNFSPQEVQELYMQHTQNTGQSFTQEAIEYAFYLTHGQPWLVNALGYQACFRDVKDRMVSITKETIDRAKETLIQRRDTHIDVLVDRLHEPRVKSVIEAIIMGSALEQWPIDDLQYVIDLGLVARRDKKLVIANPMYQEIIPRELVATTQESITENVAWYTRPDGLLDMSKLLAAFAQFFRENSDSWSQKFEYKEAGPHLLLMAFLQRIINGGGKIHREYALGMGRVDLYIQWKDQRIVIELKILCGSKTLSDGLAQTAAYMDVNAATEGHLVIFDRRSDVPWDTKIYHTVESYHGTSIAVWGM